MIASILAMDKNGCIGKNNNLCWYIKKDLKFFSDKTKDSVVIMGKNTYLSLPSQFRPLPGRINIVLTKDKSFSKNKIYTCDSIPDAIKLAEKFNKNIFFIGGKRVYEESIDYVDNVFITQVLHNFDCDTCLGEVFFNKLNTDFYLIKESSIFGENGINFLFRNFKRLV